MRPDPCAMDGSAAGGLELRGLAVRCGFALMRALISSIVA